MVIYYYILLKSEIITNHWAHLMDVALSIPFSINILSDLLTLLISPNLLKVQPLPSCCPHMRYYCFQCSNAPASFRGLSITALPVCHLFTKSNWLNFLKEEHWGPAYMPKAFRESGNLTDKLSLGPGCISG